MKKDIFNGNIKNQYISYVKFFMVFEAVMLFAIFVFFLLTALLYENIEYVGRIVFLVMSATLFLASFLLPLISIYAIRNYPKHPKLVRALIKPFVFVE